MNKLGDDQLPFDDAQVGNVESDIRETIREVFGQDSPEFQDHEFHSIWHGGNNVMDDRCTRQGKFREGIPQTITMLKGLIARLEEKREEIAENSGNVEVSKDFRDDIHPTIGRVARSRFESIHYADAVESSLKEVNACVKDIVRKETGKELDGAASMNEAFSPKKPIIVLGDLSTKSGRSIQQGYMQIFVGAILDEWGRKGVCGMLPFFS